MAEDSSTATTASTAVTAATESATEEDVIPSHTAAWDPEQRVRYATYLAEQQAAQGGRIANNDRVLIIGTDKSENFAQAGKKKVKLEKRWVELGTLLGEPYGSWFELDGGTLKRKKISRDCRTAYKDPSFVPTNDNSQIFVEQEGSNQKLTQDEIEKLKKSTSGEKMVQLLTESSDTFKSRTEFSKEKYLKRKKNKYMKEYSVKRSSLQDICTHFQTVSGGAKIGYLRLDTLSQLLTCANVRAGGKTLVIETCGGLVTAAVAERQGGQGMVLSGYHGKFGNAAVSGNYKLSAPATVSITQFPLTMIKEACRRCRLKRKLASEPSSKVKEELSHPEAMSVQRLRDCMEALEGQVDSLILASRYDPVALLPAVWELLAPSGAFAIASRTLEPLAQIFDSLKTNKRKQQPKRQPSLSSEKNSTSDSDMDIAPQAAVNMQLTETWFRSYQVLPARTHPHMFMNASGGFVLSGIKVIV